MFFVRRTSKAARIKIKQRREISFSFSSSTLLRFISNADNKLLRENSNQQTVLQRTVLGEKSLQLRQIPQLLGLQQSVGIYHIHAEVTLLSLLDINVLHVLRIVCLIRAVREVDEVLG